MSRADGRLGNRGEEGGINRQEERKRRGTQSIHANNPVLLKKSTIGFLVVLKLCGNSNSLQALAQVYKNSHDFSIRRR